MFSKLLLKKEVSGLYWYSVHGAILISLLGITIWASGGEATFKRSPGEMKDVVTIAHRGASGYAPECTLASYRLGVRMGADYIEIDLQQTKDGQLVAMHDESVNRTTDGKGKISEMTLADIKALDAGSKFNAKHPMYAREEYANERVPTLREIFEEFGKDTRYLLETKSPKENPGLEENVWALVEEFDLADHIAVQSFSKESLMKIRAWDDDVVLFQLLWYNLRATISDAKLEDIGRYANGVGANFLRIDESFVRKVKEAGLLMYPYTVNYQLNMDKALSWGADGLHTDYPDRLKEVIEEESNENV